MKEQLSHILDQSVCLTRRQVAAYLEGRMEPEELHAAQMHLASCPLCSLAMDGFEAHTEEGLAALSSLNTDFLKEQFDKSLPQIHLNSVAPAAVIRETRRRRRAGEHRVLPFRRLAAAAALLLVAGGLWWLFQNAGKDSNGNGRDIAMLTPAETPAGSPATSPQSLPQEAPRSASPSTPAPETNPATHALTAASAPSQNSTSNPAPGGAFEPQQDRAAATAEVASPAPVNPADETRDDRMAYSRSASPDTRYYGNSYQATTTNKWSTNEEQSDSRRSAGGIVAASPSAAPPAPKPSAENPQPALRQKAVAAAPPISRLERSESTERRPAPASALTVEAARKALAEGKRDEAKRILQAVVQQGGNEKREARKMLRRMNRQDN